MNIAPLSALWRGAGGEVQIRKFTHVLIVLLLLLAFALRLYRLGTQSLWYDEGVSVYLAAQPLPEITAHTARDIHPPLYYYLLHGAVELWGTTEFAAAFHSLFWGMLLIALSYRVARYLYNIPIALNSTLLLAISPFNIWYSQEVRMYTLGAFWGLVTLYSLLHLLRGDARRRYVWSYICAAALGMYTLYYFAFLLIFEALVMLAWWLAKQRTLSTATRYIAIHLAIVALYAPWLPIAYRQATTPPVPPWRGFTPLLNVLSQSWSALAFGQAVESRVVWGASLLVGIIYACGLIYTSKQRDYKEARFVPLVLCGYTFVPLALIYLLSLLIPLFHPRYLFTYSPPFYILLAAGLAQLYLWIKPRLARFVLLFTIGAIIVSVSAYSLYNFHFNARYTPDDHRAATHYLADRWRPGDAVLLNAGYIYTIFTYYYPAPIAWRGRLVDYSPPVSGDGAVVLQTGSIGGAASLGWGDPASDFYPTTEAETAAALERVFAAHERVWVYRCYDTVVDADGFVRKWLEENARLFDDRVYAGESYLRVQGYMRGGSSWGSIARAMNINFGDRLTLHGTGALPIAARAGEPLDFDLYWQPTRQLSANYRVLVGLYDHADEPSAYTDEQPLGNAYPTSRWNVNEIVRQPVRINLPPALPPGDYRIEVTVYDAPGHALPVDGAARVVIGSLQIQ